MTKQEIERLQTKIKNDSTPLILAMLDKLNEAECLTGSAFTNAAKTLKLMLKTELKERRLVFLVFQGGKSG